MDRRRLHSEASELPLSWHPHVLFRSSKACRSVRLPKACVIKWGSKICSSNLFWVLDGREGGRTSETDTAVWRDFKSLCEHRLQSASSGQELLIKNTRPIPQLETKVNKNVQGFWGRQDHVMARTAAVHVWSLVCVLDCFSLFNGWLEQPAMFLADIDELGIVVCVPYRTCSINNGEMRLRCWRLRRSKQRSQCADCR